MEFRKIQDMWRRRAPQYYWGDGLDVRYYLCKELGSIRGKKVLDIGCNAGVITSCLDKSNTVTGIDLKEDALEIARELSPGFNFIQADFFAERLPENHFDAVVLAHVLPKDNYESVHEPEELLQIVWDSLKKGGIMYLTVTNAGCPRYRGKKIDHKKLVELLSALPWQYEIYPWNPMFIPGKLHFIPGIFNLFESLMRRKIGYGRCVSFFVKAKKQ
jgi:SAM-dependent methyltransferase